MVVHELSIGDYVLAGGESAVLVMVEAICRLKPGVLGNALVGGRRLVRSGRGPDERPGRGTGLHQAKELARS